MTRRTALVVAFVGGLATLVGAERAGVLDPVKRPLRDWVRHNERSPAGT